MTIPKIFFVAVYGLLSFTAQAQNVSSISSYSGPEIKYEPAKNSNVQTQLSEQYLLSPLAHTLPLNEGFESGLDKFNNAASGNTINWSLSTSYYHSGTQSAYNASTENNNNILLETDVMDLTGPEFPYLEFWHIAKTDGGYDKCFVEISTNGGTTWDILTGTDYQGTADEYTSRQYFHENSYDTWGSTNTTPDNATWWKKEKFSLAAYKTVNVKIRFRLKSDAIINRAGWFIDDIRVFKEARIYVDAGALSGGNGTSWNNAYNSLQDAIDAANTGDEIWVASGTYLPSSSPDDISSDPRDKSFHLSENIKIYGGLAGTETMLSERDWVANETILSGDFGGNDAISGSGASLSIMNNIENAYHVFITANLTNAALIDGFTLKGGNGNGANASLIYQTKNFYRNYGGAMDNINSSPSLSNLIFKGNHATYGGSIDNYDSSSPKITNTLFHSNSANAGGAIFNSSVSSPIISNVTFFGNKSANTGTPYNGGGAVYNISDSEPIIKNNIFWNNAKGSSINVVGADIENNSSTPTVAYCLTQENSSHSTGTGIINKIDPRFVNAANGDFSLSGCPAINTGNNAAWTSTGLSTDLAGNARPFGTSVVDMGAYEFQGNNPVATIYVKHNATGDNNGSTWADAYTDLQDALDNQCGGLDIWVAAGTYLPTSSPDDISIDPRDKAFHLSKNIKIYGGFAGTETMLSERDWVANETILSGDFDADDAVSGIGPSLLIENNAENAYHVFMVKSVTSGTLDGFTISGGNANGSSVIQFSGNQFFRAIAGGIYVRFSSIILGNLNIKANAAGITGGIYINDGNNYTVTNSTISENVNGGIRTSSPITISSSIISGNKGPGIYLTNSTGSIIQNSIISFNSVGGVYDDQSNSKYINCTFYGNSAEYGGGLGLFRQYSVATIKNCIFWDNIATGANGAYTAEIYFDYSEEPTVQYCLMQAETLFSTGTGNINNYDPFLINPEGGDFRVLAGSPVLDVGSNAAISGVTTDIAGNARIQNTTVDMGVYEGITVPAIIYVDSSATSGTKNGASWANAYIDLQNAIDNPYGTTEIWVAQGTYLPTKDHTGNASPTEPRDKNFHMAADMQLYGGFTGTETERSQRDWKANLTILNGDIDNATVPDVVTGSGSTLSITGNSGNAYHVLITANLTSAAIINGFHFKGGNGNGSINITFSTRNFYQYQGGGLNNQSSSPSISNSTFQGNSADLGGGLYNYSSSPSINNTTLQGNSATQGGGLFNESSSPSINNAIVQGNSAEDGGGLCNYYSNHSIINTTFRGNSAILGGGLFNESSSLIVVNSIFWENSGNGSPNSFYNSSSSLSINHSLIPEADSTALSTNSNGGISSINNMVYNQDPQFTDAANGDLRLKGCSPAINTGDNAAWATTGLSTDLEGNARPFGTSVVDMGTYEFQGNNQFTNAIYVKQSALGDNNGSTWTNAYKDLQNGIDNQCGDLAIWVAAGTYLPKDAPDGTTSTGLLDRNNAFHLASNMKIYGGFKGTETMLPERDWKINETILSGDLDNATEPDVVTGSGSTLSITGNTQNAYHVMITANLDVSTVIDGFTLKGGNGNGAEIIIYQTKNISRSGGGGLYNYSSSPSISNVTFQGNSAPYYNGGGLYNVSNSSPSISNTTFQGNLAYAGGGLYNYISNPSISNTTFLGNSATEGGGLYNDYANPIINKTTFVGNSASRGGGLYNANSNPTISNTAFQGNSATGNLATGGGLYNYSSSPSISNTTFQGNSAYYAGGGLYNTNSSSYLSIVNSIFWENMANAVTNSFYNNNNSSLSLSHSLIPEADSMALSNNSNGGILSINNMVYNQNPQFVDAANGFLQLKCGSPAINQGTATGAPTEDITGFSRVGLPDIGAYEFGQALVDIQIADGTNPNLSGTSEIIASSQILNTNNLLYQGINNVQLLPGFSVAPTGGAATVFRAEIGGGCE